MNNMIKSPLHPVKVVSRWEARLNGGIDHLNGYDDGEAEPQNRGKLAEAERE